MAAQHGHHWVARIDQGISLSWDIIHPNGDLIATKWGIGVGEDEAVWMRQLELIIHEHKEFKVPWRTPEWLRQADGIREQIKQCINDAFVIYGLDTFVCWSWRISNSKFIITGRAHSWWCK